MKVTDHTVFACMSYESHPNRNFELSDVLIRVGSDNKAVDVNDFGNPIGVVIQTHEGIDCRTDMWGNTDTSEARIATLSEIAEYRPNILDKLIYNPNSGDAVEMPVRKLPDTPENAFLSDFPNFHKSGSISGMKTQYYGKGALLIKSGSYIYHVSTKPEIYFKAVV